MAEEEFSRGHAAFSFELHFAEQDGSGSGGDEDAAFVGAEDFAGDASSAPVLDAGKNLELEPAAGGGDPGVGRGARGSSRGSFDRSSRATATSRSRRVPE